MKLELSTKAFIEYLKTKQETQEDESFDEWLAAQDEISIKTYAGLYAWEQGMLLTDKYYNDN